MMPSPAPVLDHIAVLLGYPTEGYQQRLSETASTLLLAHPTAARLIGIFAEAIAGRNLAQLEELYIQTFDLNPDASLDVGWHLFGEDYARGEFLVKVRQEMRRYGVSERDELPDSLLCLLPLVARMPEEEAAPFRVEFLLPAIEKIQKAVPVDSNPFAHLLAALASLMVGNRTECATAGKEVR